MGDRLVVIGVGNAMRGDDGVGLRVLDELAGRVPEGVRLVASEGDPATIMDAWSAVGEAVIIDAMSSGADPGTVTAFDVTQKPLPGASRLRSSHEAGAALAVEMARALERLPSRLTVIGIEVGDLGHGSALSAAVEAAVPRAIDAVMEVMAVA